MKLTQRKTVLLALLVTVVGLTFATSPVMAFHSKPDDNSDPTCNGMEATIVGTSGADDIDGTDGDDVIVAKGGDDDIDAGAGDDVVCGGAGADDIDGQEGDDYLSGGGGDDNLAGAVGDDDHYGGAGYDVANGATGADTFGDNVEQSTDAPARGR